MEGAKMEQKDNTLQGKRLLILGGTSSSLDLVRLAQSMGIYVIVTDESDVSQRVAKQIADEVAMVSTNDIPGLTKLVKEKNIDGAFCGPGEFNLKNLIDLCDQAGLPCYSTPEQWRICSNKKTFKEYCIRNGVPTACEYSIDDFKPDRKDTDIGYPLIVKPVDGCSSKGISICNTREEVVKAYEIALNVSKCKSVVIEQYIDNGGSIFSFRYVLDDGVYYPYLTFDTYIADPLEKKYLISAFTYFPSRYTDTFLRDLDQNVRNMFRDMGLKNGVAFIQSIPYKGKIYCHEMGYRLSGGMIYKITTPLMGINDMQMMLRYALGGKMVTPHEIDRIRLKREDMVLAQLMIPLDCGTIGSIGGLDEIMRKDYIVDFLRYYEVGATIVPRVMGTLEQHFGRFTLQAENKDEMISVVKEIQEKLQIQNTLGEDMYSMKFDVRRLLNV